MNLKGRIMVEILKKGWITRKELLEKFGVAKSTLSYVISELKNEKKVKISKRVKGRGRPEEIISMNPNAWKTIGVKIGREAVVGVLMDASLKELDTSFEMIPHRMRNEHGSKELLRKVIDKLPKDGVVGIGLSVSGIVKNGIVVESPILNLKGVDFRKDIEGFGVSEVMGDIRSLAIYEVMKYGGDDFLVVNYGLGIGAGLYRKGKFSYLPIGHAVVEENGEECYCGKRGCLETVASDYANLKSFTNGNFTIKEFVEYEHEKYYEKLKELWKLSKEEREDIRKHYEKSIKYLGSVLGNLSFLLSPKKIVLYGEGTSTWMSRMLEERIKKVFDEKARVVYRKELDAFEKGAAYSVTIAAIKRGVIS